MTETSDAPMAYWISTPNPRVKSGTITTPPPRPVSDPKKPAVSAPSQTSNVISSTFMVGKCTAETRLVEEQCPQVALAGQADELVGHFAVLEDHDAGDRLDTEGASQFR